MMKINQKGFVALISVIIITLILLVTTTTLSLTGFLNRFNILEGEAKEISTGLAAACVESAQIKIARDSTYAGGEALVVGEDECEILAVTHDGAGSTVQARGVYKEATTNYEVELDLDENVLSWVERTSF